MPESAAGATPPPIEVGDVVQLRSGGATMTVTRSDPASDTVTCTWLGEAGTVLSREFEDARRVLRPVASDDADAP